MKRDILVGDVREQLGTLPDASVDCVVTSPPYWALRDYGVMGQLGLEPGWREHMAALREVFRDVHRVLKPTGNLWVNYGDTVSAANGGSRDAGSWIGKGRTSEGAHPANAPNRLSKADPRKHKLGLAWRLRFMLNDDLGFISRSDVVWHKPNAMPLSMKDRATPKYEMMFHLVKQPRYYFDLDAIRRPFSDATEKRVAQATFDQQTGGPNDYGGTMSQRGALENLARKVRTDNTWEARRGALPIDGGPAAGQKPHSTQRPFNVRVRDAQLGRIGQKWGRLADASEEEVANYVERASKPRRDKTLDPDALRPAQERHLRADPAPGEDGAFHPLGANPGDVWDIDVDEEDLEVADSVWTIPNEPLKEAHFATFPKELARRAILSSCPRALCLSCGKPRRPLYEVRIEDERGAPRSDGARAAEAVAAGSHRPPGAGMIGTGRTVRWPSGFTDCGCAAGFAPGVVLDPFAGSFTTCLVAAMNGLGWVGIELNPAYAAIGRKRLAPYLAPLSTFADGGAEV